MAGWYIALILAPFAAIGIATLVVLFAAKPIHPHAENDGWIIPHKREWPPPG